MCVLLRVLLHPLSLCLYLYKPQRTKSRIDENHMMKKLRKNTLLSLHRRAKCIRGSLNYVETRKKTQLKDWEERKREKSSKCWPSDHERVMPVKHCNSIDLQDDGWWCRSHGTVIVVGSDRTFTQLTAHENSNWSTIRKGKENAWFSWERDESLLSISHQTIDINDSTV